MTAREDKTTLESLAWADAKTKNALRKELAAGLRERPKETRARIERLLAIAAKSRSGAPIRSVAGFTCVQVLVDWLGPKSAIPRSCDGVLSFTNDRRKVRALFSRIPMARRTKMFEAWIGEGSWSKYLMPYLDLAPKGARVILEDAKKRGTLRETVTWEPFPKLRRRDRTLDALLEKYEKLLPPLPPPKPPAPGSFAFVAPKVIWPDDYDDLDEVSQSQWRQAAGAYVGVREVKSTHDFIRRLKREELNEGDSEMRRWKVMRGKEHVYDLWVVWVENGSFFHASTTKRLSIHIVQSTYEALVDDVAMRDLAEDLAASERKSLWSKT